LLITHIDNDSNVRHESLDDSYNHWSYLSLCSIYYKFDNIGPYYFSIAASLCIIDLNGKQLATSGDIASGGSGQVSFKSSMIGTFGYHCLYHPTTMKGIIQAPKLTYQGSHCLLCEPIIATQISTYS
jgi:hypothetical protein